MTDGHLISSSTTVFITQIALNYRLSAVDAEMRHHQAIRALVSQYNTFAPTVRLLSHWASKNYFSGYLSPRHVELLVAGVLLESSFATPPTTLLAAFHRCLLKLATHDFADSPIFVHFGSETSTGTNAVRISHSTSNEVVHFATEAFSAKDLGNDSTDMAYVYVEKYVLRMVQECARRAASALGLLYGMMNTDVAAHELFQNDKSMLRQHCNFIMEFSAEVRCSPTTDSLFAGPKFSTMKVYANSAPISDPERHFVAGDVLDFGRSQLMAHHWCEDSMVGQYDSFSFYSSPNVVVERFVSELRQRYGQIALIFWDDTESAVVGVALRPTIFYPSTSFIPLQKRCQFDSNPLSMDDGKHGGGKSKDTQRTFQLV
jgi:Nrap protein PAP/OAS1-like domain 5/Nrap protein domain 6